MSNTEESRNFVNNLLELKEANPHEMIDKFNALFFSISKIEFEELISIKQTLNLVFDIRDFKNSDKQLFTHLLGALQTRASYLARSSSYEKAYVLRDYYDLDDSFFKRTGDGEAESDKANKLKIRKKGFFEKLMEYLP